MRSTKLAYLAATPFMGSFLRSAGKEGDPDKVINGHKPLSTVDFITASYPQ